MQTRQVTRLTESALMIAFATVLSLISIIELPYGGSVTAASMLPLVIVAYRYGTKWGLFTGLIHGILQLFLGIKNVMGVNFGSVIAILLLDYLVAFAAMGLAGVFRKVCARQADGMACGALLGCVVRYGCHVLSGCTVWAEYNYTELPTVLYSLVYNATYMLPETLITVLAAYYIGSLLDFRGESIVRLAPTGRRPDKAVLYVGLSNTLLAVAAVYDIQAIFVRMQDADTGLFSAAAVAKAPWLIIGLLTAGCLLLAILFRRLAARVPETDTANFQPLFRLLPPLAVVAAVVADGFYVTGLLTKAAEKAELAAPFTSGSAFFAAMGAMGTKYGLPALVATLCVVVLAILVIRHMIVRKKSK